MGFVVVNNLQASATNLEKFLTDIGLYEALGLQDMPGGLLGLLQAQALLGEGFNPNGGFAVVMLDPQQFGVDLTKMMGLSQPDVGPADTAAEEPKIPLILLVPGSSVQEVFGQYTIEQAGDFQKVSLRMGPMLASQCGSYVALSPTDKALAVLMDSSGEKAPTQLSASQQKAIATSDIAMYLDMKIAGPIYLKILDTMEAQMGMGGPMSGLMKIYMPWYRQVLSQVDSATITGQFVPTGVLLKELVTFAPESELAKLMAVYKPSGKLLDKLPDLPYIFAAGSEYTGGDEFEHKFIADMMDALLATEGLAEVPEDTKAKAKQLSTDFYDQLTGMQFVGGGAPEGSGVFGLACVMKCKDAEALKAILTEAVPLKETFLKALFAEEDADGLGGLSLTYVKDYGSIGEIAVDTVNITHPELLELSEDERAEMTQIFGEDSLRIRIAAADAQTVVVTFGGAEAFMAEAIKTTQAGGTILQAEGTAEAMQYMPKDSVSLMFFNAGNLFDVIVNGMQTMAPEAGPLPFALTTKTPIAAAVAVHGNEAEIAAYVPSRLVQEIAQMAMMFMMPQMPPPEMEYSEPEENTEPAEEQDAP